MNETSATSLPGASLLPSGTGTLTTIHLVLIVLIALAAIAIIVAGIRRKRASSQAAREVDTHAREAGVPVSPPTTAEPEPVPEPVPEPLPPIADEPIAAAAPLDATPATLAAAAPVAASAAASPGDGAVTQLKGLGPKVAARLAELGVTTVGQIAALDDDGARTLDAELGAFRGRMMRDRWIEQARFLAAGDRAGFEAVFGRL